MTMETCASDRLLETRVNEPPPDRVTAPMKAKFLSIVIPFALASLLEAQTCREQVRDASGRIVQTIERKKTLGGTVQATTRDASGRIIGTSTTSTNAGGGSQSTYRDASGRLTGTATKQPTTGASSRTTYRDASGRLNGSADTRADGGSNSNTQYRDASGRLTGSSATSGSSSGSFTGTRRDASGRLIGAAAAPASAQVARPFLLRSRFRRNDWIVGDHPSNAKSPVRQGTGQGLGFQKRQVCRFKLLQLKQPAPCRASR